MQKLKYSKEQMQGFLDYAKEHGMGTIATLKHFNINRRTFFLTLARYGLNTDEIRKAPTFNTIQRIPKEKIEEVIRIAKNERISFEKACRRVGISHASFTGGCSTYGIEHDAYFCRGVAPEKVHEIMDYVKENPKSLSHIEKKFKVSSDVLKNSMKKMGIDHSTFVSDMQKGRRLKTVRSILAYAEKHSLSFSAACVKLGKSTGDMVRWCREFSLDYRYLLKKRMEAIKANVEAVKENQKNLKEYVKAGKINKKITLALRVRDFCRENRLSVKDACRKLRLNYGQVYRTMHLYDIELALCKNDELPNFHGMNAGDIVSYFFNRHYGAMAIFRLLEKSGFQTTYQEVWKLCKQLKEIDNVPVER